MMENEGEAHVGGIGGVQTVRKIVPSFNVANIREFVPAHNNNYLGTEWTIENRLKGTVKQGDLADAETEVIVNSANSRSWGRGGRFIRGD